MLRIFPSSPEALWQCQVMLQGRMGHTHVSFHAQTQNSWALQQDLFQDHQPWTGMEGVLALLPVCLQADGISGEGARARWALRERPAGSRQSFLGKPSPWEGGQAWSCSHGTCQALGRASSSCHAPLQGISAAWKCSYRSFWLHGDTAVLWVVWEPPSQDSSCPVPSCVRGHREGWAEVLEVQGNGLKGITSHSSPSAKPLPHFQPSLPVTELLLSGLVWIRH